MRVGADALYPGEVSYLRIYSDLTSHSCELFCHRCEYGISPRSSFMTQLALYSDLVLMLSGISLVYAGTYAAAIRHTLSQIAVTAMDGSSGFLEQLLCTSEEIEDL